ncbi:uncharacterized protein [Elaeis guineensis]|uniref:uncharacterized protein n=1 Tax=Elaeis guineensis var. tenera TaxID=51953 RepID=UPI003C6D79DF
MYRVNFSSTSLPALLDFLSSALVEMGHKSLVAYVAWYWGSHLQKDFTFCSPNLLCWLPPPIGVLKINFDASITANKAAAGYVIRNTNAVLMRVGGKLLPHISVPFAELLAAWLGVRTAIYELHATYIWIEGDSSTAVSCIKNPELQRFGHMPFLQDLIQWQGAMHFCKITHIFREANQVADYMARLALQGDFVKNDA